MATKNNWSTARTLQKLQSIIDAEIGLRSFQLARYLNDVTVDLEYFNEYSDQVWNFRYWNVQDADLAVSPKINVIKSVIDTLVSKLASQKVRPYFNPVNGLYETRKIVKQAQQFFDIIYDTEHISNKMSLAYRNACIFGSGYVFFNTWTKEIEVPGTWQVGIANTEKGYGTPTKLLVEYKNMPVTMLSKYGITKQYGLDYVRLQLLFDTVEHKCFIYVENAKEKEAPYRADIIPIVSLYHTRPVFGTRTTSIVDELNGIQANIDIINAKISAAGQLTPANTTFVEAGSSLTTADISNKTGNAYLVKMGPNHNQLPVVNVTPAPFDPMWSTLLDTYVQKAYEIVGISQLSAQSQKPSGLDSGVALSTMEDIESDRFQTQVDNYVHAFVDLANLIIEVMDDGPILPKSIDTADYTWDDIRKQKDLFKVQFSAASALSKDPATKIQQILQLTQIGLITTDKVALYLDSPDLEDAYRGAAAVQDAIDATISNAIEKGIYEIPEYVGYQQLLTQIIIEENKLWSVQDSESLVKLEKLKTNLLEKMNEEGFADLSNQPPTEQLTTEEGLSSGAATDITGAGAQAASYEFPNNAAEEAQANPIEAATPVLGENNEGTIPSNQAV